jgi:hypothetical protein
MAHIKQWGQAKTVPSILWPRYMARTKEHHNLHTRGIEVGSETSDWKWLDIVMVVQIVKAYHLSTCTYLLS